MFTRLALQTLHRFGDVVRWPTLLLPVGLVPLEKLRISLVTPHTLRGFELLRDIREGLGVSLFGNALFHRDLPLVALNDL